MNYRMTQGAGPQGVFWTPENHTTNINEALSIPEDFRLVNLPECVAHLEAEKREWWTWYLNQKDEQSRQEFLTGQLWDEEGTPRSEDFFKIGFQLGVVVVVLVLFIFHTIH